jgi:hypothetical protein
MKSTLTRLLGAAVLLALSAAASAAEDLASLAAEVRATESAFAKTLADRDV